MVGDDRTIGVRPAVAIHKTNHPYDLLSRIAIYVTIIPLSCNDYTTGILFHDGESKCLRCQFHVDASPISADFVSHLRRVRRACISSEYRDTISEMYRRVAGTVVVGGFDVLSIQRSVVLRVEMGLSTDSDLIIYVAIPQYQF